jgi:hypothetical protein
MLEGLDLVSQQANKETHLKMSTSSASTTDPKRAMREKIKAQSLAKEKAARMAMMEEATHKIAYLKTICELANKTPCASDKVKAETMAYFNEKIRDLETDATGKPRYSYNLNYPSDIGFAANGRPPVFADEKFTSIEGISDFIRAHVEGNSIMFYNDKYNIPSTKNIEEMFQDSNKIKIDINDEDVDEDEYEKVPFFTVTRTRVNY